MSIFTVEVTQLQNVAGDWRHRRIGQIDSYLSLETITRYNDVGTWSLKMLSGTPQAALLGPGTGIVVWGEGMSRPLLSGPVTAVQRLWSDQDSGPGSIVFSGVDHNTLLAEHICMPDPGNGLSTADSLGLGSNRQSVPYYGDGSAYSLERMIYELVYMNLGPGAWAPRQLKGVSVPASGAWPASTTAPLTTFKLRFDNLLEALKSRTETDKDGNKVYKGYRMVWNPLTEKVELQVFTPNSTAQTRFSSEIGNLRSYSYQLSAPKANFIWGLLDTEDDAKPQTQNLYYINNSGNAANSLWQVLAETSIEHSDIQLLKHNPTDNAVVIDDITHKATVQTDLINTTLNKDATDLGPMGSLSVEPINTLGSKFGVDYWLGDLVTVAVDGTEITDILREVHVTDSPDGPVITPTIGDASATETPAVYKDVKKLWDSVRRLQRLQTRK